MTHRSAIIWLACCLLAATASGVFAYRDAVGFSEVVDLLATIVSILVGVSLAVIAVLTSPFTVSENHAKDADEATRLSGIVNDDDETFADGQVFLFYMYFGALGLALIFKWATAGDDTDFANTCVRSLAAVTAAVGVFAFTWSARLPTMLKRIAKQRRSLG